MTGKPRDPYKVDETSKSDASFDTTNSQNADAPEGDQSTPNNQGYTAAQLRMARRKARRLGLNPSNGKQAIRMLNSRGIAIDDNEVTPAEINEKTQISTPQKPEKDPNEGNTALMRPNQGANLPAEQVIGKKSNSLVTREERQSQIAELEKKIKNRRETKMRKLIRRFSLFVLLPTILMGIYYYVIATPLYGANTVLNIQKASSAGLSGANSLLAGTPFASAKDSVGLQDYLQSRNAYKRLEEDYPFSEQFMGDEIDPFLRIPYDASEEERYKLYGKMVKVSFDSTDQVFRMEVKTPSSESALEVSELLLSYAEERVDSESQRIRDSGVADAEKVLAEKKNFVDEKKRIILDLQLQQGTLDPIAQTEGLVAQIETLRNELNKQRLILAQLESVPQPNAARVNSVKAEIGRINELIDTLTNEGTGDGTDGTSLARLDQEMQIAEAELLFAQKEYELASTTLQLAETEARSQRTFITTILPPTSTFAPIYPKKLISTLSAFMIFFAAYILVSMTVEVIREQVSA